jgi:hypothetical protein
MRSTILQPSPATYMGFAIGTGARLDARIASPGTAPASEGYRSFNGKSLVPGCATQKDGAARAPHLHASARTFQFSSLTMASFLTAGMSLGPMMWSRTPDWPV